jgi:predicted pyridoxine 5'-phosphate oxidase superfamily flavin-nucleotide-binding protein
MQTKPSPLKLTTEIKSLIAGAFDSGNVLVLGTVSQDQKPLLSFRGSTAVFDDEHLSFWIRNNQGGTIEAIRNNPQVAMMYRSSTVPMLQFSGRARIAQSPGERDRVFGLAHQKEQAQDPERKGVAVIVELDKIYGVLGFGKDGPIWCSMERAQKT